MFSIFLYGFKKVLEEADNDGKEFSVQMKMVADEKRNTRKEKKNQSSRNVSTYKFKGCGTQSQETNI